MTCARANSGRPVASEMKMAVKAALVALGVCSAGWLRPLQYRVSAQTTSGVAILQVDTDRRLGTIDLKIYGQFLEHINHSVEDGLFAEQIRGAGFEGEDFKTYWEPFSDRGRVEIAEVEFQNGKKSVRLNVSGGRAGIRQGRIFLDAGSK